MGEVRNLIVMHHKKMRSLKNYDRIKKFGVCRTEKESEVRNPIIILGG